MRLIVRLAALVYCHSKICFHLAAISPLMLMFHFISRGQKKNRFIRQVVISTQQSCMCIRCRLIAVCLPLNVSNNSSNKIETQKQFGNNNKMYWKAVVVHKCVLQVLSNPLIVVDFTAQSNSSGNTQINCFKPIM